MPFRFRQQLFGQAQSKAGQLTALHPGGFAEGGLKQKIGCDIIRPTNFDADERSYMEFVKINQQNFVDVNKANQPFEIIGKIKPVFANGIWTYSEELYEQSCMKAYPNDTWDYGAYINNPDKTIFLAYSGTKCVGQIILKRDWNKYAFIEDICVAKSTRGQGVGSGLIQKAIEWAESCNLKGLALETQDNNLLACRFYAKCGFVIGAVNTMLYRNFDSDEFAVFWYLPF